MALTGFDPRKVYPWSSKYDTTEPKTIFRFRRTLTKQEHIDIDDTVFESKGYGKKQSQKWKTGTREWRTLEAVFTGPGCGWDNLNDDDGQLIPFSPQSIDRIDPRVRTEIYKLISPNKDSDEDDEQD